MSAARLRGREISLLLDDPPKAQREGGEKDRGIRGEGGERRTERELRGRNRLILLSQISVSSNSQRSGAAPKRLEKASTTTLIIGSLFPTFLWSEEDQHALDSASQTREFTAVLHHSRLN